MAAFLFDAQQPGARWGRQSPGRAAGAAAALLLRCCCRAALRCCCAALLCLPSCQPAPPYPIFSSILDAASFQAALQRMLAVASASGDVLPCLFLQAHEADASPLLVRCELAGGRWCEVTLQLPSASQCWLGACGVSQHGTAPERAAFRRPRPLGRRPRVAPPPPPPPHRCVCCAGRGDRRGVQPAGGQAAGVLLHSPPRRALPSAGDHSAAA